MLLVLLAACGARADPDVVIDLSEWGVGVSSSQVSAGEIAFHIVNNGLLLHEVVVLDTPESADALATRNGTVDFSAIPGDPVAELGEVGPSDTLDASLLLEPGTYVLFCNIPGHYSAGMYATLEVTAGA